MNSGETVFLNPQPIPPREAVDYLVALVAQRELLFDTNANSVDFAWVSQIDDAISRFVDEYCGTRPPRPFPPFPFLQLDSSAVVTELTVRANMLNEGGMRDSLLDVARTIVSGTQPSGERTRPATCEELAEKIQAQEATISALQSELGDVPTPKKGAIVRMILAAIKEYNMLIRQARMQGCPVP